MKALSAVLAGSMTLLVFTTQASASVLKGKKPKNVFFTGKETPGEMIEPGSTETVDDKIIIRGNVQRAQDITDDERVQGELIIETNACLDPRTLWGPVWGTFVLANPGGKWLAAWIGQITAQGVTIFAMAYGSGWHEGLMANWTYTRIGADPQKPFNIQGFIVRSTQAEALLAKTGPQLTRMN